MAMLTVPVRSDGYPSFDLDVSLDGSSFNLAFAWGDRDGHWYATVSDAAGAPIVSGRRLVSGWDVLRGCVDERRPLGRLMVINSEGDADPGQFDLGQRCRVVYEGVA